VSVPFDLLKKTDANTQETKFEINPESRLAREANYQKQLSLRSSSPKTSRDRVISENSYRFNSLSNIAAMAGLLGQSAA
jgi:hypothetical protein